MDQQLSVENANDDFVLPKLVNNNDTSFMENVEQISGATSFACAIWSENFEKPEWNVNLLLNSETPDDLGTRIGFIVVGINNECQKLGFNPSCTFHSRHDNFGLTEFNHLLNKGYQFSRLELNGDFFNNAQLYDTAEPFSGPLIQVPNLKKLVIKAKISQTLKGLDEKTQKEYFQHHFDFCSSIKMRAAKNLWYVLSTLSCSSLTSLEIKDSMDWEDEELVNGGFYYWEQPLIDFLQRHASTLQTLKLSPLILRQLHKPGQFNTNFDIPNLQDLQFWMKLHLDLVDNIPEQQLELTFQKEIDKALRPWRNFLQSQSSLKTLLWITDTHNPWTFTKRDFVQLCQENSQIESLMVALHGDQQFREICGLKQRVHIKDFQIDSAIIHGVTALRVLSIGCYNSDPQITHFCMFNIHLLPRTLEKVHLLGVRAMSRELESLAKLPNLKSLTIIQGGQIVYSETDEANKNVEGVTANVLQTLLNYARRLDNLTIIGFPIRDSDYNKLSSRTRTKAVDLFPIGLFGTICGPMCFPEIPNEDKDDDDDAEDTEEELRANIEMYPKALRDLLQLFSAVGEVRDLPPEENDGQILTMLRIGEH